MNGLMECFLIKCFFRMESGGQIRWITSDECIIGMELVEWIRVMCYGEWIAGMESSECMFSDVLIGGMESYERIRIMFYDE